MVLMQQLFAGPEKNVPLKHSLYTHINTHTLAAECRDEVIVSQICFVFYEHTAVMPIQFQS